MKEGFNQRRGMGVLRLLAPFLMLSAGSLSAQEGGAPQDAPELPAEYAPEGIGTDFDDDDFFDLGEGEEITKTGTPDTNAQVKVIPKEEIERIAAPDLPTLLEEALDMGITRHGAYGNSSDINIRGFDTERVAILIDGVPVNSAMSGDFDFNTLDMNNIERVEVIYGGSDSKYNVTGALGGVVNIITVKDRKKGLRFGAGVSNISYMPGNYTEWDETKEGPQWQDLLDTEKLDFSLSWGAENFSWGAHAFANRAGNHYLYKDSFLHKVRRKEFNEVWDLGGGALFSWSFANLSKLFASADAYYSDKNIPATGFSSVIGRQNDVSTRGSLRYEMPVAFREDLSTEAALSCSWARMDYDRQGMPFSRHDQQGITMINRWGWYPAESFTLRAGWDYRYIGIDSTDLGRRDRQDGGVYLTGEFSFREKLLIVPSIKAVTDGSSFVPVPKLGFVWKPADFFTLKNNYFRSFKFPDFEDLYWSGGGSRGNPDLLPEDGWGADIGAEYRYEKFITVESVFFGQYIKDSIRWRRVTGGFWEPQNIDGAALFGLDTRFKAAVPVSWGPIKKISPGFSYQYLLSYLLSYGYDWGDGKRIPYQPAHTVGLSLDIPWETGSLLFSAHYESIRYYSVTNLIELDPYLLLTLNVSQKIGRYFTLFTVFRNLLNQSYESYNRYPMPGLSITVGARVSAGGV